MWRPRRLPWPFGSSGATATEPQVVTFTVVSVALDLQGRWSPQGKEGTVAHGQLPLRLWSTYSARGDGQSVHRVTFVGIPEIRDQFTPVR